MGSVCKSPQVNPVMNPQTPQAGNIMQDIYNWISGPGLQPLPKYGGQLTPPISPVYGQATDTAGQSLQDFSAPGSPYQAARGTATEAATTGFGPQMFDAAQKFLTGQALPAIAESVGPGAPGTGSALINSEVNESGNWSTPKPLLL